jgi:site-specific DNA-methyltransferase (adenine-specific)
MIITKDVLQVDIEDNTVDLIVTSPPYNLGIKYTDNKDNLPYDEYMAWVRDVLSVFHRVLKSDGRFAIVVPQKITIDKVCENTLHFGRGVGYFS